MNTYGLIGKKLSHSFSKKYFTEKFQREHIAHSRYELFELPSIEHFTTLVTNNPSISGLNVTIPYKQEIIPFLDDLDELAFKIGAVNVIKFYSDGKKRGFNSDCIGFSQSLTNFLPHTNLKALVLGTGGAAKAVMVALETLNIPYQLVSRTPKPELQSITYEEISSNTLKIHQLIINTTPLGMYPNTEAKPTLPYASLSNEHYLYDLVYNPKQTAFMQQGILAGAQVKNGIEMLHLQAEAAWEIWNR
ncbi:MAG: shikimate dehydrogenase family protein [Flammeovirgaceae bacterium]